MYTPTSRGCHAHEGTGNVALAHEKGELELRIEHKHCLF